MNSSLRSIRHVMMPLVLVLPLCLASCAGPGETGHGEEHAVNHTPTAADLELIKSQAPVTGSQAVLYVNGLGCPLCASNIDQQLLRVRGVEKVTTDLSQGLIAIDLTRGRQPSPARLAEAVEDAGFTLVKIETR